MKKGIVLIIISLAAWTAKATDMQETLEICTSAGDGAEEIMLARQHGRSLSQMLKEVMSVHEGKPGGSKIAEKIIMDAFEVPRFSTERMQERAAQEFRDKVELQCFKDLRG